MLCCEHVHVYVLFTALVFMNDILTMPFSNSCSIYMANNGCIIE